MSPKPPLSGDFQRIFNMCGLIMDDCDSACERPPNKSLVSVLVALAELADSAPKVLASPNGKKAIQFAL
jgi:hypothetical protein